MAALALAAVGAGVGSMFGSAALGWTIGSAVGSLLFPAKVPDQEGPRLTDLSVTSSAYGAPIPEIYGTMRSAGALIWSSGLIETSHEEEVGGKGGGGASYTTYSYRASFALAFCAGPIAGVRKLWADGKLIYDMSDTAAVTTLLASADVGARIRIYRGTEDQLPDPTIEAYAGAGNVPAHRGLAYLVFEDFELADYGNRIPNITAEIVGLGATSGLQLIQSATLPAYSGTKQYNGLSPYIGGRDGISIAAWADLYDAPDNWVTQYTLYPDGSYNAAAFQRSEDEASGTWVVADAPCLVTGNYAGDNFEKTAYWAIHNYANPRVNLWAGSTVTIAGDLYTSRGYAAMDSRTKGRLHLRDGVAYFHQYGKGVIKAGFGGTFYEVLRLDDAGSPTELLAIAVGREYAYGLRLPSTFVVFNHEFEALAEHPFTPGHPLLGDAGKTTLFVDEAERIYMRSSFGLHRFTASGEYEYLGNVGGLLLAQWESSWGVYGDVLTCIDATQSPMPVEWYRLSALSTAAVPLAAIIEARCARAGLAAADIDTTAIAETVHGYAVTRQMSGRASLEPLQIYGAFDVVESDWKLKFIPRGGASVAIIPAADLAAHEYGQDPPEPVASTRAEELALPREVTVLYVNPAADYQQGAQADRRILTGANERRTLQLPIAMSDDKARQIAQVALYDAWTARTRRTLALTRKYLHLDPTDVVGVEAEGVAYTVRLEQTDAGAPGLIQVSAVDEDAAAYSSAAVGGAVAVSGQSLTLAGPTRVVLADTAALRDEDNTAGFYVAAAGLMAAHWRGAVLYKSADAGVSYEKAQILTTAAAIGSVSGALPAGPTTLWDTANTLTVRLLGGTLVSATELAVYNGANAALLGAHGRWEVIQFQDAALNADGTYTLSRLLRGRRGTEHAVATHQAGDTFLLLTAATLGRVAAGSAEIGAARLYKAVSIGRALADTEAVTFTNSAAALKPLSPAHIRATRNADNNLVLTWIRRARLAAEWRDGVDVPLDEASEAYEVEVLRADGSVRYALATSSPTVTLSGHYQDAVSNAPLNGGDYATHIVSDGGSYLYGIHSNVCYKFNAADLSLVTTAFAADGEVTDLLYAAGALYIACTDAAGAAQVRRLNTSLGVTHTYTAAGTYGHVARNLAYAGGYLWASTVNPTRQVVKLDPATLGVVASFAMDALAIATDGTYVYGAYFGKLSRLTIASGAVTILSTTTVEAGENALVVTGTTLYAGYGEGNSRVRAFANGGSPLATLDIPAAAEGGLSPAPLLAADATFLYVGRFVYRLADRTLVAGIDPSWWRNPALESGYRATKAITNRLAGVIGGDIYLAKELSYDCTYGGCATSKLILYKKQDSSGAQRVRIYQMSATVGRGYPAEATVG